MLAIRNRTIIVLVILAVLLGSNYASAKPEAATSAGQTMVVVQVFPVDNLFRSDFSDRFLKIADLATFNVVSAASVVELTYNGRAYIKSFDAGCSGAYFELRVDGFPTTIDYARDFIEEEEVDAGIHTSIIGVFTNLSPGTHTANMMVKGLYGGGTVAAINPGGLESDKLIIKEYLPFGFAYLPFVQH